ncbi:hypothetical protein F4824DRAFT_498911 [Ustulina deusta]|nr:hypothetical protein F4824DRAFT_504536 [Ustulina deusta]KAI3339059.1 hypothetical protein F4824DRAFT_498911 [Ustulina deusta]
MQNSGEWDNWLEEQCQGFLSDTFPTQDTDMTSQQAVVPVIPEGQGYESWTSNEDIKSLLIIVGSRLDKIEAALHETKTLSRQACDGLCALKHGVGGVGEAVERLKKSLSAFQKCLYRLLIGGPADEGDKSVVVEFT